MDDVEKAERPPFLSMGPVPDSQRAPLSNLDLSQKSATLRSHGGRPFAGFTRLVFAGSPNVCALQMRTDAEVAVTMARATGAKQMAYAIIRGKSGRRHEVDSGSSPLHVEVHASEETVEILLRPILTRFRSTDGALQL